jgi:DNA-binding Xre family transcriptional regulator
MSIIELAEAADMSIDTLKNLIYGRVLDPKISTLIPLCDALDCSIDYLTERGSDALQQVRDLSGHSLNLLIRMTDAEFRLTSCSDRRYHEYRSVIIPNTFTSDHIEYDSCSFGYIDILPVMHRYKSEEITCGLMLQGDELAPIYFDGDVLLLNGTRSPKSNEIGLYIDENKQFYIRRYLFHPDRTGHLHPLLPNHEILPLKKHRFRCYGTVLGLYRGKVFETLPESDTQRI